MFELTVCKTVNFKLETPGNCRTKYFMKPTFEPTAPLQGFDATVTPNWLMVPLNGEKQVFLKDSDGMTVTSVNPAIAEINYVDPIAVPAGANGRRAFSIRGNMHGHTFIEVRDARNRFHTRLEVAVKLKKNVKLAFNFVKDNAQHRTHRTLEEVKDWMDELNVIYPLQTNIVFELVSYRWVTVDANLGGIIGTTGSHKPDAWVGEWIGVVAQRNPKANVNLFLVWEYDEYNPKYPIGTDTIEGATVNKDCLIEDDLGGDPTGIQTIAHEIGHALGIPGESHYFKVRNSDTVTFYGPGGFRIGKVHANMINR